MSKNYINHYSVGFVEVIHKNKRIATSLGAGGFESYVDNLKNSTFDKRIIPAGYEHRADLLSNLFYSTPTLDWMILYFNNIKDPFNELNVGDTILIPRK